MSVMLSDVFLLCRMHIGLKGDVKKYEIMSISCSPGILDEVQLHCISDMRLIPSKMYTDKTSPLECVQDGLFL